MNKKIKEIIELNNKIQKYDVLLTHTKFKYDEIDTYILPYAIRKMTNSYYNHVAIVTEYMGEKVILEAVANGFRPTKSLPDWLAEYPDIREFAVLRYKYKFDENVLESRLNDILFNKYDFKSTLWQQFKYQFNKYVFGIKKPKWKGKNDESAKTEVNCSEAIAYAFELEGWWKVVPKDIYNNKLFNVIYESRHK